MRLPVEKLPAEKLPAEKPGVGSAGDGGNAGDGNAGDVGVLHSDKPSATVSGRQPDLPPELMAAVRELAARPRILVALDFDGVLAPIVDDPSAARPLPEAGPVLQRLATAAGVQVALVSGRTLGDLRRLASPPPNVILVGSHGAQWADGDPAEEGDDPAAAGDPAAEGEAIGGAQPEDVVPGTDEDVPGMDEQARALLARVTSALEQISARHPGSFVEHKPAGAVLHTRQAPRNAARRATEEALSGPSTWEGVHLTRGKEVVDLSVVDADKGSALTRLRSRVGLKPRQGGVLYVGDDVTDERAFAVLDDGPGDVTVKVGGGPTIARHRVDGPLAVVAVLGYLADQRGS
jgi:trehalose-6-phosphatase